MPQLNPEFFSSQILWLIITFSFLFLFMWRISLPRIGSILEKRKNKINEDIQLAKKIQTEAEEIQLQIDEKISNTYDEVKKLMKEKTNALQQNMSFKLQDLENELFKKITESGVTIEKNKNKALSNINIQIQEITKSILTKLTTMNFSNESIFDSIDKMQKNIKN